MKKKRCNDIAAVILAAGEGKRFGKNKALADTGGVSFLEKIAGNLAKIGCNPVIAVLGSQADDVAAIAKRIGIEYIINSDWRAGQFSSLKIGLSAVRRQVCGAIIALVDHPLVRFETYLELKNSFAKDPVRILIPTYNHRRGHPLIIPAKIMREVIESPDDISLKTVINKHEQMVNLCKCDDPGVIQDIDSIEDIERALDR